MAQITIGGKEYLIPEMNFLAMERAWPYIEEATSTLDPMRGPSAAIAVFASGLMEADDFDKSAFGIAPELLGDTQIHIAVTRFLKKQLKAREMSSVRNTMFEVLREAGLEVTEGEAVAALKAALETPQGDPIPSPETAHDTFASLSQLESKEEVGIS